MARSKLTEELTEAICEQLKKGLYRVTVAQLVGITSVTFSQWMHGTKPIHKAFQAAVLEAEAEAERLQLEKITESPDPVDAKWYLARKHPDRWAETKRIDVSGRLDLGMRINADALTSDAARAHIIALTDWLYSDGDSDTHEPGSDSDS